MKMIDVRGVSALTDDSVSQIWKKAAGDSCDFPKPVKIGGKTLWVEDEVVAYLKRKVEEFRAGNATGKRQSVFKAAQASAERRAGGQQ
jgi:predicted DNA-binding transcriptional regulator AlpA